MRCSGWKREVLPKHVNVAEGFVETSLGTRLEPIALDVVLFAKAKNEDAWEPYEVDDLASYMGGDHASNVAMIERLVDRGHLVGTADGKVMVTSQMIGAINRYIEQN